MLKGIRNLKIFCVPTGNRNLVPRILGKCHTTIPPGQLAAVIENFVKFVTFPLIPGVTV